MNFIYLILLSPFLLYQSIFIFNRKISMKIFYFRHFAFCQYLPYKIWRRRKFYLLNKLYYFVNLLNTRIKEELIVCLVNKYISLIGFIHKYIAQILSNRLRISARSFSL